MSKAIKQVGGSWFNIPRNVSSAVRNRYRAGDRSRGLGFRLAEAKAQPAELVLLGGSWTDDPRFMRTVGSLKTPAANRFDDLGFRIVKDTTQTKVKRVQGYPPIGGLR